MKQQYMHGDIKCRLEELKREYSKGQRTLHELERQTIEVRETLLRISGAVQVLQEILTDAAPASAADEAQLPTASDTATPVIVN